MYTLYYTVKCQTHCKTAQSTLTHKNKNSFDISQTAARSSQTQPAAPQQLRANGCSTGSLRDCAQDGAAPSAFCSPASTQLSDMVPREAHGAWLVPHILACLQLAELENLSAADNTKYSTLEEASAANCRCPH